MSPAVYGVPRRRGAAIAQYPLDVPPVFPSVWDDDFSSLALAPKWTAPTTSATGCGVTTVLTVPPLALPQTDDPGVGCLLLGPAPGNSSKHMFGVRQAAPSGSFTLTAKLYDGGGGNDVRAGIFVGTTGGKGNVVGPFLQDSQVRGIGVSTVSNTADWSGYDGYQTPTGFGTAQGVITWVKFIWDAVAATLAYYGSQDGSTWTSLGTRSSMTQPDQIGVGIYSNSGATGGDHILQCLWFRVTTP